VHRRVALTVCILGRTRRADDRRIDDRPRTQAQTLARQMRVDLLEELLGQVMLPRPSASPNESCIGLTP